MITGIRLAFPQWQGGGVSHTLAGTDLESCAECQHDHSLELRGKTRFTLLLHLIPVLLLANIGEVAASKQSARQAQRRNSAHRYLHDLVVLLQQPRQDSARVETTGIANDLG